MNFPTPLIFSTQPYILIFIKIHLQKSPLHCFKCRPQSDAIRWVDERNMLKYKILGDKWLEFVTKCYQFLYLPPSVLNIWNILFPRVYLILLQVLKQTDVPIKSDIV